MIMRKSTTAMAGKAAFLLLFLILASNLHALGGTEELLEAYDNIDSVSLSVPDWDVELGRTHRSAGIELETSGYDRNLYQVDVSRRGSSLEIEVSVRPGLRIFTARNPRITLLLPENLDLSVRSGSGDITLEERVNGVIDIESSSGEIRGNELRGRINVRTGSGDIRFDEIQGELSVGTSSGDVRIERSEGLLSLESSSGSIELRSSLASVEAKSSSGDIRLYNFEVFDAARFASSSGDISIELLGDVQQFRFSARTASGDIRIFNQESDGRLEAGTGNIPIEISSGSGDIRVY
jgi:hypothetical protein